MKFFGFTRTGSVFMPYVRLWVYPPEGARVLVNFLVDSGAASTIISKDTIQGQGWILPATPSRTGLQDAKGVPILGSKLEVNIDIQNIGRLNETVIIADDLKYNLLGHNSFFGQLEITFRNYEPIRQFCFSKKVTTSFAQDMAARRGVSGPN